MGKASIAAVAFLAAAHTAAGQTHPAFEVASVKPHDFPQGVFGFSGIGTSAIRISGNRVTLNVVTLSGLVRDAYNLRDFQITGAPGWMDQRGRQQFYDIAAKTEGDGAPTLDQVRQMLQTLLADRFHLKIHREMKELPVYDLVVGKNGIRLKESTGDSKPPADGFTQSGPLWRLKMVNRSMADIVNQLASNVDRPVLDKTGLTGLYDFTLEFVHNNPDLVASDSPDADRSIFGAIQDQLGLKLVPAKEPAEILVIDHAERPSEN